MELPKETIWDTIVSDHEHVWDNINFIGREAMASFLQNGESVLDVGCGNGFVYRAARKKGLDFSRYVGVDLSTKFLAAANKLSPELETVHASAEALPFKENEFDTVILMHVLECLDGYEKAVMEALRVAKGRVIVCFWKQFADKTTTKPTDGGYGFESIYGKDEWLAFLEKLGMPVAPWIEVHAEANRSNLFFVLEKKNLKVIIAQEPSPEVQRAINENVPPNTYTTPKRNVEQENLTWNPPVEMAEATAVSAPGVAAKKFKGLGLPGPLQTAVVDSDDLCDEYDPYDVLVDFKSKFPKFKITLFAIPKKCSSALLEKYSKLDWVEMAVHGYDHDTNREYENMAYADTELRMLASFALYPKFSKVFKAPGWQLSTDAMKWLTDSDWIVMDQHYNNDRRPEGLKTLVYADEPTEANRGAMNIVHSHTWDTMGNGIKQVLEDPWYFDQNTEFKFVSEVAQPWKK